MNSQRLFEELSENGVELQISKTSSSNKVRVRETVIGQGKKICSLVEDGWGPTLVGFYPSNAKNVPREFASYTGLNVGTRFEASEDTQYRIVPPISFGSGAYRILQMPSATKPFSPENYSVDFGFEWEPDILEAPSKPEELLHLLSEYGIRMSSSTSSHRNDNKIGIVCVKSGNGKEYIVDNVVDISAYFYPDKARKLPEKILASNSKNVPIVIQTGDVLWRIGGYAGDSEKYSKVVEIPKYLNLYSGL